MSCRCVWEGGTQLFFCGCVPHGFLKVGSGADFPWKNERNWENLRLESWNGQNKAENAFFSLKIEMGGGGDMSGALMVNWVG